MKYFKGQIIVNNGVINAINNSSDLCIICDGIKYNFGDNYLLPGFVDSHGHIINLGEKLLNIQLDESRSEDECIQLALNNTNFRGEWLYARGWNNELWDNTKLPLLQKLDDAFPNNPVILIRVDGHAAWVNSVAMKLANINDFTPNPIGGEIKKINNRLSGILVDNAINLVTQLIPPYSVSKIKDFINAGLNSCAKYGITEVHDMDVSPQNINIFKELDYDNKLPIRVDAYLQAQNEEYLKAGLKRCIGNKLNIIGIKFIIDGALGSHGAALIEPYYDDKNNKGLFLLNYEELYTMAKHGLDNNLQIASHAIGDAANNLVCDVYSRLYEEKIASNNTLLRIEHAQILNPKDLFNISKYPIIASVQPIHFTSDSKMAKIRLGKQRCKNAYRWNSLLEAGITIISGSDFPIDSHNPLLGIDALTNRKSAIDNEYYNFSEKLTIDESIKTYNYYPHLIHKNTVKRGEIKVDFDADFVVINNKIDNNNINDIKVVACFCAGKPVYIDNEYKKHI